MSGQKRISGSGRRLALPAAFLVGFLLWSAMSGLAGPVRADAGPKPSLTVRVIGADSPNDYYLDLLVPEDGSFIAEPGETGWLEEEHPEIREYPIYQYREGGRVGLLCHGYAIWGDLSGSRRTDGAIEHRFTYMAVPDTFAVLVQDRATGTLRVSETVTTTQFDALVTYDLETNTLSVRTNTGSFWWWLKLLGRVFLTVLVECLLVLPFRFPKRRWLPIPVNLATQGLLHVLLVVLVSGPFQWNYLVTFAALEALVILVEFLAYFFWMAERKWPKPLVYTILANGVTLALGLLWLA